VASSRFKPLNANGRPFVRSGAESSISWVDALRSGSSGRAAASANGGSRSPRPPDRTCPTGRPSTSAGAATAAIARSPPTRLSFASATSDTTPAARENLDVLFPLALLRRLATEGGIGELVPHAFSFMGIPEPEPLLHETGPAAAVKLAADAVRLVLRISEGDALGYGLERSLGSPGRIMYCFIFGSARQPRGEERSMRATDELLQNAETYADEFDQADLPMPPAKHVAVVACMDARLNPYGLLGLKEGEAHVIRNAGGVVTDDVIRSLAISQHLLGTAEIVLIHHTDCGMLTFRDDDFRRQVQRETGIKPAWAAEAFDDLDEDVRQSIARLEASPFIPHKENVRGFVYDVTSGRLREVS
jgi:carbonic anhydrase